MEPYIILLILIILSIIIYTIIQYESNIEEPFYTLFLPFYHPNIKDTIMEERTLIDLKFIISSSQWRYGVFRVLMRILIGNNDINIGQIHLESMDKDENIIQHIDGYANHVGVVPAMTLIEHYDDYNNIRYITSAFEDYVFFITQADNDIVFLDDLKGKTIGVGKKGNIWNVCADELLTERGFPYKPYYSDTIEDMANKLYQKKIDAIIITDRFPSQLLNYVLYNFFNMTLVQIKQTERIPFYYSATQIDLGDVSGNFVPKITAQNKYLFFNAAMDVYKFPNYMICNKDIPKDIVYRLTDFMFKNAELMKKDKNPFVYIDIPLHEGATEYYRKNNYIMDKNKQDCVFTEGEIKCGKEFI